MEVIILPSVLPSELDLEAINRQLCSGTALLDWSNVRTATPDHLHVLLAGLDLVEHNEVLGIATVPDTLAEKIFQVLVPGQAASPHKALSSTEESSAEMARGIAEETASEQAKQKSSADRTVPTVLHIPSQARLREELQTMVIRDLLGPAGGADEELTEDRIHDRYLVGMLAPEKVQTSPEEQEELGIAEEGADEEGPADASAAQVASLNPSSLGMSFCVDKDATTLLVTVRWGHYQREESQVIKTKKDGPKLVWRRRQRESTQEIALKEGMIPLWQPAIDEQTEVFVKGIVRNSADEYRCAVGAPCCTWPVPQGNPFCRIAREATILRLPVPS